MNKERFGTIVPFPFFKFSDTIELGRISMLADLLVKGSASKRLSDSESES